MDRHNMPLPDSSFTSFQTASGLGRNKGFERRLAMAQSKYKINKTASVLKALYHAFLGGLIQVPRPGLPKSGLSATDARLVSWFSAKIHPSRVLSGTFPPKAYHRLYD